MTSSLRQNDVILMELKMALFWRYGDIIIMPCVQWSDAIWVKGSVKLSEHSLLDIDHPKPSLSNMIP